MEARVVLMTGLAIYLQTYMAAGGNPCIEVKTRMSLVNMGMK